MGILILANQYCQPRLINLCELYITKEVDRSCTKNIEKSEIDVIGLLLTAQVGMIISIKKKKKKYIYIYIYIYCLKMIRLL